MFRFQRLFAVQITTKTRARTRFERCCLVKIRNLSIFPGHPGFCCRVSRSPSSSSSVRFRAVVGADGRSSFAESSFNLRAFLLNNNQSKRTKTEEQLTAKECKRSIISDTEVIEFFSIVASTTCVDWFRCNNQLPFFFRWNVFFVRCTRFRFSIHSNELRAIASNKLVGNRRPPLCFSPLFYLRFVWFSFAQASCEDNDQLANTNSSTETFRSHPDSSLKCPLQDIFVLFQVDMLRISMLLSCIFMTNTALDDDRSNKQFAATAMTTAAAAAASMASTTTTTTTTTTFFSKRELSITNDFDRYAVTCYICVNVSDNPICNQFAIDRPCRPGETFCHTLHIMDSSGSSVLVNKKCTSEKECQRGKVGCVQIDAQTMCVSCCDQNYCNENVPTNATNAIFDDKISKMRMLAKNMFKEREKAMTTTIKDANQTTSGGDRRERRRNNLPLAILFLLPLSQTSSLSSTLLAVRCYFNGVIANTRLRLI